MVRWLATAVLVVVVGTCATACSFFGPTTKEDVCQEFDELGERFLGANGIIDNLVFLQAGTLADVADRYEGAPSLAGDAAALEAISDADTTTGFELMAATDTIAGLCGYGLGEAPVLADGGDFSPRDDEGPAETESPADTGYETPTHTTTEPSSSTQDVQTVTGPGGISVDIPAGWTLGGSPAAANRQASDPGEPAVFVRFGASAAPDVPILTEIQNGESGNPNVRNGYQRVRLAETTFLGAEAVDWEFTFVKDGNTRHAHGRYWRQDGLTYVIYLSAPDDRWPYVRWVFDVMADSTTVH